MLHLTPVLMDSLLFRFDATADLELFKRSITNHVINHTIKDHTIKDHTIKDHTIKDHTIKL